MIGLPRQSFMAMIRVNQHVLLAGDLVIGRKLRARRADGVHQAGDHKHLSLDAGRQVLAINIS